MISFFSKRGLFRFKFLPLFKNTSRFASANNTPSLVIKSRERSSVRINIHLDGIKNTVELLKAQEQHQRDFSIINSSTFLKKLSKLQWSTEQDKRNLTEAVLNFSKHFYKLLKSEYNVEENLRALANSFFYLSKTLAVKYSESEAKEILSNKYVVKINTKLIKTLIENIDTLNPQETANVVYSLSKLREKDQLLNLAECLAHKLPGFEFQAVVTIFYSYLSIDVKPYKLLLVIHSYLKGSNEIGKLASELDFPHIVYCYSRCNELLEEFPNEVYGVLKKLEEGKMNFFENITSVGLSTIFSSLIGFKRLIFSIETLQLLESKAIQLIPRMEPRALANIIRGFSHWGIGSNLLYQKSEENIMKNFEKLDETSFFTFYYCFVKSSKGTLAFYKKYHEEINLRLSRTSALDFNYLLYSVGKLLGESSAIAIDDELIKGINEYIILNFNKFEPAQIKTVCRFFKFFFQKHKQKGEEVYYLIRNKIADDSLDNWDGTAVLHILLFFLNQRPEHLDSDIEGKVLEKIIGDLKNNAKKYHQREGEASKYSELTNICIQTVTSMKASQKRNELETALTQIGTKQN